MVKAREIRSKSVAELATQLVAAKEELFRLRFQHATHQLDDTSQLRLRRRDIARIQTVLADKIRVGSERLPSGNLVSEPEEDGADA